MKYRQLISAAWRGDEMVTNARGWAANLAMFRVVFLSCVALPWGLRCYHWTVSILPHLPRTVWQPISFYQLIPLDVLCNTSLARALALANIFLIGLAIIGFRTRLTLSVATFVSFYVFGLMENIGKVDHFHHVIWFMAMVACGPSALLFSVDAVIQAYKGADQGTMEQEFSGKEALWTFRYIWILLGLLYLGPGLAKLESAIRTNWAGATNMQNLVLRKWVELSWYDPHFTLPPRVDRLPRLFMQTMGWSAIAFESGFVFVVLFRFLRPALALIGILFHVWNGVFLGIWFTTIVPVYACLLDWAALGRAWNHRRSKSFVVVYDGGCELCRRTIAILKSIDLFDGLTIVAGFSGDARRDQFPQITDEMLARDLYVVRGQELSAGYDAYVKMAERLIILWPLAVIMRLPPVATAGRGIYRRIAEARKCTVPASPRGSLAARWAPSNVVHWTGIILSAGQLGVSGILLLYPHSQSPRVLSEKWLAPVARVFNGVARRRPNWPFDLYPTFAGVTPGEVFTAESRWALADGSEKVASPDAYWRTFANPGLTWNITSQLANELPGEQKRAKALDLVKALWLAEDPEKGKSVVAVRVFEVRYKLQSAPGPLAALLEETLIFSFPVSELKDHETGR